MSDDHGHKMTRDAYSALVESDLAWLRAQPRTLERDHVEMVLVDSVRTYYPPPAPSTPPVANPSGVAAGRIPGLRRALTHVSSVRAACTGNPPWTHSRPGVLEALDRVRDGIQAEIEHGPLTSSLMGGAPSGVAARCEVCTFEAIPGGRWCIPHTQSYAAAHPPEGGTPERHCGHCGVTVRGSWSNHLDSPDHISAIIDPREVPVAAPSPPGERRRPAIGDTVEVFRFGGWFSATVTDLLPARPASFVWQRPGMSGGMLDDDEWRWPEAETKGESDGR